jgi:hypothetical protein
VALRGAHSFEEERKELGAVKAKLVKENEVKKARLEELEQQLTDFVNVRLSLSFARTPECSRGCFLTSRVCASTESKRHPGKDAGRADSGLTDQSFALNQGTYRMFQLGTLSNPILLYSYAYLCPVRRTPVVI